MAFPLREVKFITQRRTVDAISDIAEVAGVSEQARGIQFQVVMGTTSHQSAFWYRMVEAWFEIAEVIWY